MRRSELVERVEIDGAQEVLSVIKNELWDAIDHLKALDIEATMEIITVLAEVLE